ncbi:FAD-dependent oxidoreductase [Streptomyces sp. URMC 123]|uniref:FAD-dependent oxidoreductase n=1 Tax=Streptomyces sp. URMC 123 TaxID=3423403 RepID=UPI003F1CE755
MDTASDPTYDVVVVGSGAAGLTAAIAARLRGLSALVLEKTDRYGGTTALSGGTIWMPATFHLDAARHADTPEKARAYLDATVGDRVPGARKDAYLTHGPRMVRELHRRTAVRFVHCPGYPDYYPELPGGSAHGRSIEARIADLNRLAPDARRTLRRSPLPLHGLAVTSRDFHDLNMAGRTWAGRRAAVRVGARALGALLAGRRQVSLGEALVARMRFSLDALGGDLWLSTPVTGLVQEREGGRVTGVRAVRGGRRITVRATGGVILASGGFSRDQALREKHLPSPTSAAWSSAPEGQTGDALAWGAAVGAAFDVMDKVWGAPSALLPGGRPYLLVADRGIPGMVVVDGSGARYTNEAAPYHAFVDAMYAHHRSGAAAVPSWMVLDARSRSRYLFLGLLPGQPVPARWLADGCVRKADTLDRLAADLGVPAERLRATVHRFNEGARVAHDEDFHRGESVYDRYYGDPTLPNPNLAPLEKPPFYATAVHPGDLGTKGGLVTDDRARVLREDGTAIDGLYASGNVSASVMGATYPGPGATIGPAMTFGWIAATDIAAAAAPAGHG